MQACCEYYLLDDPELGPEVLRLRPGVGYRDLAADLLGYADLYTKRHDVVRQDRKYYRATDRDEAVRIAEQILELLGETLGPTGRTASSLLGRTFDLLRAAYQDVSETGRWLLRADPERERLFPSIYSVGRSRRSRRTGEKADTEPGTPSAT
jgi:hypothetical protein